MNGFDLRGKTFLITGAASGIGESTAIILDSLGAKLISVDKSVVSADIPGMKWDADLTQMDLKELFAYQFDGFVHCAGVPCVCPLKVLDKQKTQDVWNINTWVALELAKYFTLYQKKGSIVFISSDHALVGSGVNVGYAASKAALHGITKTLAIELAPKIRVNCIAPGFIKTPMADAISPMFEEGYTERVAKLYPLGLGEPEDVAYAIAYLLSDASKWVTGTIIPIDGGYTAQ